MKQKLCHILTYTVILRFTFVVSTNSWPSSKKHLLTSEGSGGNFPGSGPGTDDEDQKVLPYPRQSTSHLPISYLPHPTSRTKPKQKLWRVQKQLSGDEGSGMTKDTERQESIDEEHLRFSMDKRKETTPTPRSVKPCDLVARKEAVEGFRIPYKPECDDDGNYLPLQCASSDCFCVNTKDGTIIDNTRMVPGKKIRCHWVHYRIQIPISPFSPMKRYKEELMGEINKTARLLMGRNVFTFKKFISHSSRDTPTGIELECRSIGLTENYPLRSHLQNILSKFQTNLGNLDYLNVTEATGKTEVRQLGPGSGSGYSGGLKEESSGRLAGDETADTSNAGKSGYSVRNGEDSKTPGDDPKQASGTSASKKGNNKKMATLIQQPGIIAAIIGGGIAAFLLAILLILFCIYRIRKKDEGSYALEEPKKTPVSAAVYHSAPTREYYA